MGNAEFDYGHNEELHKPEQQDLFENLVATKPQCNIDPRILKAVLDHYIKAGFPYQVLSDQEKMDEFDELRKLNISKLVTAKVFYSDSTGVALANSYHPHRYDVSCGGHRSALSVFKRPWLLQRVIRKCIALSGSVSDSKLRSMLSIFEGTQVASNFPPGTARAIYNYFLPDGGLVWDMSCGFGGRLLAALSTENIVYYGTDPSTLTHEGLKKMRDDLIRLRGLKFHPAIMKMGSEVPEVPIFVPQVDFCFTSPPYFNTEKYSDEDTQSYRAYPYKSTWIKKFIGGTAENCRTVLRSGSLAAVNIASVKSFPEIEKETVKEFCKHGFKLDNTYFLAYSMMPGKGAKNKQFESGKKHRMEPIFIFKKE